MAGRPKTRDKRARRAYAKARYENAGDYIRYKATRAETYGPVRFEAQPRWVRALGRKQGMTSEAQMRKLGKKYGHSREGLIWTAHHNAKRDAQARDVLSRKDELAEMRAYLKKRGVKSSDIATHIRRMSKNGGEATSEVDLPGGGIAYIQTLLNRGRLKTTFGK